MNISRQINEQVVNIILDGRFDANTSGQVEQFIRNSIGEGHSHFILDMGKVPYIASAGLRVVLSMAKELRQKHNGDLRIAALQPNVARVFEISGLNNVLQIFPGADEASGSFSG